MKILFLPVAALALRCLLLPTPGQAQSPAPVDPLARSRHALAEAPSYQATQTHTFTDGNFQVETLESVGPGLIHIKSVFNGKNAMELITDGKREFLYEGGRFVEEPGNAAATLASAHNSFSFPLSSKRPPVSVTNLGCESVDGKSNSVYVVVEREPGLLTTTRLWIADADQRPIKTEKTLLEDGANTIPYLKVVTTYSYDPSIQVKLPVN